MADDIRQSFHEGLQGYAVLGEATGLPPSIIATELIQVALALVVSRCGAEKARQYIAQVAIAAGENIDNFLADRDADHG